MKVAGISILGLIGGMIWGIFGLSTAPEAVRSVPEAHPSTTYKTMRPSFSTDTADTPDSDAEANLRKKVDLLEQGKRLMERTPSYSAVLRKQEVVGGQLLEEQQMAMKCRHKPFSVYLVWLQGDVGREVLYVEGKNNGKMLAHDGGWKARLPAFSLDIDGRLAMEDTRYSIRTAGLLGLIDTMLHVHQEDLKHPNLASCEVEDGESTDGRPCLVFTTQYKSAIESPTYRKSITLIDKQWNLPIQTWHYEWPRENTDRNEQDLDSKTLIEFYEFTAINLDDHLTDRDFDRSNSEYHFR